MPDCSLTLVTETVFEVAAHSSAGTPVPTRTAVIEAPPWSCPHYAGHAASEELAYALKAMPRFRSKTGPLQARDATFHP